MAIGVRRKSVEIRAELRYDVTEHRALRLRVGPGGDLYAPQLAKKLAAVHPYFVP